MVVEIALAMLLVLAPVCAVAADLSQEKTEYGGWPNCVRLTNGKVELIATTDVGPRLIRFGFVGGQNLFKEYPEMIGKTGGGEWRIYGGHRLWHAPEAKPRTYSPDNGPIQSKWDGKTLKLIQPVEADTGILKEIEVTLDPNANHVHLLHRLTNRNLWAVELAPWALTVMAQGGRAIFPQERFISHEDELLPARPVVLWHYTNMADPRWTWSQKYIQLRQDPSAQAPQKIGIRNTPGWAAYALKGDVFIKRFQSLPDRTYPDFGCNNETFTNADMLEVESVGPLGSLAPGATIEHVEDWYLFKTEVGGDAGAVGADDAALDAKLLPLVRQTEGR